MPAVKRDGPASGSKPRASRGAPAETAAKLPGAGLRPKTAMIATGGVILCGVVLLLATGGRAHALEERIAGFTAGQLADAGFNVNAVDVSGASSFSVPYILRAAELQRGQPILGLDLEAIRERVEKVGWVKSVRVLRLLPDTLVIAVDERPRLAVWQINGQTHVVDPDGQIIPEADPGLFVDLPLIVGDGANEAAGAILPELQSRPRLMSRIDALVRVDGRRWDLRMKDGGLIQLPAEHEDSALIQLDQLDQKDRLLDLGFERVDLRDPEFVAVRPRQAGPAAAAAQSIPSSSPAPNARASASGE